MKYLIVFIAGITLAVIVHADEYRPTIARPVITNHAPVGSVSRAWRTRVDGWLYREQASMPVARAELRYDIDRLIVEWQLWQRTGPWNFYDSSTLHHALSDLLDLYNRIFGGNET